MSDLPEGWTAQALGSVADCRLGKMLDAAKNQGELRPYLRNTNVQWGTIDLSDIKEIRIEDHERDRYAVLPGDLLVCEGGEPGRCAVWRDDREMYLQKALHRVRPLNGTSVDYLRWFLQHATSSGALENLYTGSTIKHLPGRQLAQIIVPVPPVEEQRSIASWLEELDARRASIADRLAAARALVDRVRAAVLAAACSGRLTPDWRGGNPEVTADELFRNLTAERPRSRTRGQAQDDGYGLTSQELIGRLPRSWALIRLGDVLDVATGATPLRQKKEYYEQGTIPWVTSGAVNRRMIDTPTDLITRLAVKETNVKLFPPGTLLVAMYGEGQTRGRVGELAIEAGTNQAVAALLFDHKTAPLRPFVRLFLEDSYRRMRALSVGGVQPNLNLGLIKETLLPLPPHEEQLEIRRRANAALSAADRLEAQLTTAGHTLDRASRSALAKAFRGELVAADTALAEV